MKELTLKVGEVKYLVFKPMDSTNNTIPGTFSTEEAPVWTIRNDAMLVGEPIDFGNTLKVTGGPACGDTTVEVNASVSMLPRGPYTKSSGVCVVHVVPPAIASLEIEEKK